MNNHDLEKIEQLSNELLSLIDRYKSASEHDEIFEVKKDIRQQIQEIERRIAEIRKADPAN